MKDPTKGKHSHNNRESREGQVLRFIREAKKLSLKDVAEKLNIKSVEVDHFENGRKFYTPDDVKRFLDLYAITEVQFKELMSFKILNRQLVNHYLTSK